MRVFFAIFIACFVFRFSAAQTTFVHDNVNRSYFLHLPTNLVSDAPLIFVLHGYSGSASAIRSYSNFDAIANQNGFAVCYPEGLIDQQGQQHWNSNLSYTTVNDTGFLSALAVHLQNTHSLSPSCTFVCGMSNGGYMSSTLACERPDIFRATASVTGTMSGYDWLNCNPSSLTPQLHIHGTADGIVPIDGSMNEPGGWSGAPHQDTIMNFWGAMNGCQTINTSFVPSSTNLKVYTNCTDNKEVWYYKVNGMGHTWPSSVQGFGVVASDAIWQFFSQMCSNVVTTVQAGSQVEAISIAPNPTQNLAILQCPNGCQGKRLTVRNSLGQLLSSRQLIHDQEEIDLSAFTKGIYIASISEANKQTTQFRLIRE